MGKRTDWEAWARRQGGTLVCFWCGVDLTPDTRSLDHLIPASLGGKRENNLVPSCKGCNTARSKITDLFTKKSKTPWWEWEGRRDALVGVCDHFEALIERRFKEGLLTSEQHGVLLCEVYEVRDEDSPRRPKWKAG